MEEQNLEKKLKGSIWKDMKSALWIGTTALAMFSLIACQTPQDTTPKEPVYQEQKEEKGHQKEDKFIREGAIRYAVFHIPDDVPDYLSAAIVEHANFRLTEKEEKMMAKWDTLLEYVSTIDFFNKGNYVDPLFMKAIVAVESRGNRKACSKIYHARGLSQIRYWRAKPYAKRILENKHINLAKIAQDIGNLGYDTSCINEETLKNIRPMHLHNGPLGAIMLKLAVDINYKRFGDRPDLHCAEWHAGLTKGIVDNQVANIKPTIEYTGKVTALYNIWYRHKKSSNKCIGI